MNNDPYQLLLNDYPHALVRLATRFERQAGSDPEAKLIFGIVELYPKGMQAPQTSELERGDDKSKKNSSVFYRQVAMDTSRALSWYRSPPGAWLTPLPSDIPHSRGDGSPLTVPDLLDEPSWPQLAIEYSDEDAWKSGFDFRLPFVADWQHGSRFHRRLARCDSDLLEMVKNPANRAWLERRLFVDLVSYQEFLGGLVLIAPNPLVRSIQQTLLRPKQPSSEGERICIQIEARPSCDVSQLEIVAKFIRSGALVARKTSRLNNQKIVVFDSSVSDIQASGYEVVCPTRGIVAHEPEKTFFRSIRGSVSAVSREIIVSAPSSRQKKADTEVRKLKQYSGAEEHIVGTELEVDIRLREMWRAANDRARRLAANDADQLWVKDKTEAREFIRKKIASANDRVWMCDPYMADLELLWFVLDAKPNAQVRILTSRSAFKADLRENGELKAIGAMAFQMNEMLRTRSRESFEVKVMRGDPPPLHDRLLICDNRVWLSGNSFGTAGDRMGVIIRLPDHEEPIRELSELFANAQPFQVFAQERLTTLTAGSQKWRWTHCLMLPTLIRNIAKSFPRRRSKK